MAHEIYTLKNGKDSMAYVGDCPWHGLGQELTPDAPLSVWLEEAGLNWELKSQPVYFPVGDIDDPTRDFRKFSGQNVIYRSDTMTPLSVVSDRYNLVQPKEVLEFFRSFVEAGDMTIETAGSLKGGTKIWALSKLSEGFEIADNDKIEPYLLMATSCDGTLATTVKLTSVRVVCNNTLNLSVNDQESFGVKVPHSRVFNPDYVKGQLGLVNDSLSHHRQAMKTMAGIALSDQDAMRFFLEIVKTPEEKASGKVDIDSKKRSIPKLWESYKGAPGAQDTVWGAVNAVTHAVDYNKHARSDDTRLNSAWFGVGATMKQEAYKLGQSSQFLDSIISKTEDTAKLDNILSMVSI